MPRAASPACCRRRIASRTTSRTRSPPAPGLCDRDVVEMVVREAPEQIDDLIRWGTHFDEEDGQLALTREGGHSHRRIVHALGDATGPRSCGPSSTAARQAANVTLWDDDVHVDLLTHEGPCAGALVSRGLGATSCWSGPSRRSSPSGGAGMVYRETTNPPVATGDGMAAAYRAGAELRDMEFMQFHPTVLYVAGSSRFLISEAVRGEGAYLRDKNGVRFMLDEDPRAELAPRDVVAQAIFRCMERTQHPNVYLDLSHLDAGARARCVSPASTRSAAASASTSPAIRSRCGPGRTTWSAA